MSDTRAVCVLTGMRRHRERVRAVGTSLGERAGEHRMLSPDGSTSHDGETLDVNAGGVTPMT